MHFVNNVDFYSIVTIQVGLKETGCARYTTSRNNRVNYIAGRKCRKNASTPGDTWLSSASVDKCL